MIIYINAYTPNLYRVMIQHLYCKFGVERNLGIEGDTVKLEIPGGRFIIEFAKLIKGLMSVSPVLDGRRYLIPNLNAKILCMFRDQAS